MCATQQLSHLSLHCSQVQPGTNSDTLTQFVLPSNCLTSLFTAEGYDWLLTQKLNPSLYYLTVILPLYIAHGHDRVQAQKLYSSL